MKSWFIRDHYRTYSGLQEAFAEAEGGRNLAFGGTLEAETEGFVYR